MEGFDIRPRAIFALLAKTDLTLLFWPTLGHSWCPVVTVVTFSNNSKFKKNTKSNKSKFKKNTKSLNKPKKKIEKKKPNYILKNSKNLWKKTPKKKIVKKKF